MHIHVVLEREVAIKMLIDLLRRFIPKESDIEKYTDKKIKEIEDWINNYPDEIFGYKTDNQVIMKFHYNDFCSNIFYNLHFLIKTFLKSSIFATIIFHLFEYYVWNY